MVFLATNCASDKRGNTYIGDIPAVTASYVSRILEYERKADASVELDDAFRYNSLAKKLAKEADREIKNQWKRLPKPVNVSFKQELLQKQYIVKKILIDSAGYNKLHLSADVEVKYPEKHLFIYLRPLDSLDREISGNQAVLISSDHPENNYTKFTGIMPRIEKLSGLFKFEVINKTSYQHK